MQHQSSHEQQEKDSYPMLSIVTTKMLIPGHSGDIVARQRLEEKLDGNIKHKLTTVTAPSGYGKTTLVANWATRSSETVLWVSLDLGDNDMMRFWHNIIASVQTLINGFSESILKLMHSFLSPPIEVCIAQMAEEFNALKQEIVIVLDDFHVIDNVSIHRTLTSWIDYLPQHIHLILISRSEPALPLSRLRARGQLLEISMTDLQFQFDEIEVLCNRHLRLGLSLPEIVMLMERTEGWVIGMKLAALTLQNQSDSVSFIDSVRGSHRYIMDFLAEEVLLRQAEHIQAFLLQTSISERITGALCDRLTGRSDGSELLLQLEKSNLFIVALDQERKWYRYHHLFADFLRNRLFRSGEERVNSLHRRAAAWLQEQGSDAEAIVHWLAANSFAEASELIGKAAPYMLQKGEWTTLNGWLSSFPPQVIYETPRLSIAYAWSAVLSNQPGEAERIMRTAGRTLTKYGDWQQNPEQKNDWLGEVALVRMIAAFIRKDIRGVLGFSRESIRLKTTISEFVRVGFDLNVHEAFVTRGILGMKGQFRKMASYFKEMEADIEKDLSQTQAIGYSYIAFGEIMYEWNKLLQAEKYVLTGIKIGEDCRNAGIWVPGTMTLAKIKYAQGKVERALELISEAIDRLSGREHVKWRSMAEACATMLWIRKGREQEAIAWLKRSGPVLKEGSLITREFEHITMIRALTMLGRMDEAHACVERLLHSAEKEGRMISKVEVIILQAMMLYSQGHAEQAAIALRQGLLAAEREGYIRLFVDEGERMADLLKLVMDKAAAGGIPNVSTRYIRMLLNCFIDISISVNDAGAPELTSRQWEILNRVAAGETNPKIAEELFITAGTLKMHLNHIYKKINVDNREQAK